MSIAFRNRKLIKLQITFSERSLTLWQPSWAHYEWIMIHSFISLKKRTKLCGEQCIKTQTNKQKFKVVRIQSTENYFSLFALDCVVSWYNKGIQLGCLLLLKLALIHVYDIKRQKWFYHCLKTSYYWNNCNIIKITYELTKSYPSLISYRLFFGRFCKIEHGKLKSWVEVWFS